MFLDRGLANVDISWLVVRAYISCRSLECESMYARGGGGGGGGSIGIYQFLSPGRRLSGVCKLHPLKARSVSISIVSSDAGAESSRVMIAVSHHETSDPPLSNTTVGVWDYSDICQLWKEIVFDQRADRCARFPWCFFGRPQPRRVFVFSTHEVRRIRPGTQYSDMCAMCWRKKRLQMNQENCRGTWRGRLQ